jgi:peroxin-3
MTLEVRKRVEGATEADRQVSKWLKFLLPPRDQEDFVLSESGMASELIDVGSPSIATSPASPLRRLLDETSDLIDSPSFAHVLTLLLDAGFSMLVDQKLAQQSFKVPSTPTGTDLNAPRVQELVDIKPAKLPIVLATITRQAHNIGNGVPNEYLQTMEQVRDLEAFAAVVYSSNWESEIAPVGEENPGRDSKGKDVRRRASPTDQGSLEEDGPSQGSIIDISAASTFESVWGKAIEAVGKGTKD